MVPNNLEFILSNGPFYRGIRVHAYANRVNAGTMDFCNPWTFTTIGPKEAFTPDPAPCAVLSRPTAQRLMDELWKCGIRPAEGQGSAGQLAAVQAHLADMQTIAFKQLKIRRED